MKTIFLILSVVLTLGSLAPYIRGILRGQTKPNIVSWSTWTLLTTIATVAEIAAGEYVTAIITGAGSMATLTIALLGLRYGYAKYSRFDTICQVSALIGIVLWQIFNSPAIAIIAAISLDFIGALPTYRHSWLRPHEEIWQTFLVAMLGSILALLALSSYNLVSLAYPVYLIGTNGLTTAIILFRSKHAPSSENIIKRKSTRHVRRLGQYMRPSH